ncbi:MAG: LysM peptidoglycan-binding domain-containing protein [Bacillota bacterium]|nr:LysM peptidoglycan-binding domain-containing protein [Bacillota bacterium]
MNTTVSERRIRNNRIRRRCELRRRFITCILTLILTAGFSLAFFSFRTKAQGSDEEILYKYYKSVVVEAGDTLWNYADEYGNKEHYRSHQDYIDEVMQMNGLTDDNITKGQHIILPYYSSEFM